MTHGLAESNRIIRVKSSEGLLLASRGPIVREHWVWTPLYVKHYDFLNIPCFSPHPIIYSFVKLWPLFVFFFLLNLYESSSAMKKDVYHVFPFLKSAFHRTDKRLNLFSFHNIECFKKFRLKKITELIFFLTIALMYLKFQLYNFFFFKNNSSLNRFVLEYYDSYLGPLFV